MLYLVLCGILISINWGVYIWAINYNHIAESSMGYFINPLMIILFGALFFSEKLEKLKIFAILLVIFAILLMIIKFGKIPYIALILSSSFAIYALIKKGIKADAYQSFFIETLLVLPFALIYIFVFEDIKTISLDLFLLMIPGGIITALPLMLFASGVKKIKFSTQGFLQFIGPTMMFLLAKYIYKEYISPAQMTALYIIWMAVVIFIISLFTNRGKS